MRRMAIKVGMAAGLMSAAVLAAISAATVTATAMSAEWCAVYRSGSENCGFYTQAQCSANVSGIGGFCRMSQYDAIQGKRRR